MVIQEIFQEDLNNVTGGGENPPVKSVQEAPSGVLETVVVVAGSIISVLAFCSFAYWLGGCGKYSMDQLCSISKIYHEDIMGDAPEGATTVRESLGNVGVTVDQMRTFCTDVFGAKVVPDVLK